MEQPRRIRIGSSFEQPVRPDDGRSPFGGVDRFDRLPLLLFLENQIFNAVGLNRTLTECPDTEAVFVAYGLAYDTMLCKPDGGPSDKNPRFEAVARGTTPDGLPPLEVVAFVGDNIQDFPKLNQSLRNEADSAFSAFGARYFVLPNPMYGSWERN